MSDQSSKQSHSQPDALRRRLMKGGMAAPVVLATLASKPVLGGNVPWTCTISGQVSGNMSGHEGEICTSFGTSQSSFAAAPYYPDSNTDKLDSLGVTNYFFISSGALTDSTTSTIATIHQILSLPAPHLPLNLQYAIKALVLLLNAKNNTDPSHNYPLTEFQAKTLYEAAATGSEFHDVDPDPEWNSAEVKQYIDLLWH